MRNVPRSNAINAGEGIRSPFTRFCGLRSFDAGVKSKGTFASRSATDLCDYVYAHTDYQCLPNYPHPVRSVLLYCPTPARAFDLEQTSLSFSTLASLFLMFARCLVHGSVAPTFRRGAGALSSSKDPWACDAVSQVSSAGRQTEKKGAKRERRERRYGDVWPGRNSRTSFLDGRTWEEES